MDIPERFSVRIHPRSGLALKSGITLINCEGVIDSDYVEPTYITLLNLSDSIVEIKDGDRVAQGELVRSETYEIEEMTDRPEPKSSRKGGFGSTGA
jgi:dUTP pyrophosphatase